MSAPATECCSERRDANHYLRSIDCGVAGLKIGVVRHYYAADEMAHPEQIAAIDAATDVLANLGAEIREIRLPPKEDYRACCALILFSEAYSIFRDLLTQHAADLGRLARERLITGATISAADYLDAQRWRARLTAMTEEAFRGLDAAITSTNLDPAFPMHDIDAMTRALARHSRHPFSVTGHPAIAVPAGFTCDNLPLSLQIVGHYLREDMVYRVAHAYERATDWTSRRPPAVGGR